ncbi:MAG: efflux RND transporter periplasmic adaptor subunit, partial [Candidatus Omnitrophica bacterium]|nr:efflux RND transporter periplasmic adaptor subunit [Candidatus Omnitrophota bacterium]
MKNEIKKFILGFMILFFSLEIFFYLTHKVYAQDERKPRKILYYRNPMNPSITSKVPMKDQMGMDYIPVRS